MTFNWNGRSFEFEYWTENDGVIGDILALDTETTKIVEGAIPQFVIGQAYAGGNVVYGIRLPDLGAFMKTHSGATLIMHNAAFDVSVIEQAIGFDFDSYIRGQKLFDTGFLYQLFILATDGIVPKWSLGHVTSELLGIELNKDDEIRMSFDKYYKEGRIDYDSILPAEIQYAATDTLATFEIFQILYPKVKSLSPNKLLSHKIQIMGSIALDKISRRGFGVDSKSSKIALSFLDQEIENHKKVLAEYGYYPGQAGVDSVYGAIIEKLGISIPKTESGQLSSAAVHLEPYRAHPFVESYLSYEKKKHLRDFVAHFDQERLRTKFVPLVKTGRTSSRDPNLQNIPRDAEVRVSESGDIPIRHLFKPASGHTFIVADYSQLELCTLAQVCLDRFKFSKMAEAINANIDLHSNVAATLMGLDESAIGKKSWERRLAKAVNFGFPGGLSSRAFLEYAFKTYSVSGISEAQAELFKQKWLSRFPEMKLYLKDPLFHQHNFKSLDWCDNPEIAYALFKRIIKGAKVSTKGRPYDAKTMKWAFETVLRDFAPHLVGVTKGGSEELAGQIFVETVSTLTGRIRANAAYCQARNFPFQGLASDGAKIALYRLMRAGISVVNFVHDEIIAEVPRGSEAALKAQMDQIKKIMIESMQTVVPDVKIDVEIEQSDLWEKP